ncbi:MULTISPECIES: ParB/RepB/Spo0J family partition protein [unclassified Rhodococcus (in: high G+C Gram-positive bacteria)]|jgi:ParB family transcriptional regulator, chromosome partitioning protein|uniref:ParB/RepB/Spo0J family partition protein n=1 Tax=unclassified Rhodococcus (in: high G+C Gram-positive bacteria) TaxID=192944 RepID=UPI001C9A3492|nr:MULTISPECIES: ParB/RepB/Spo0J family partition protein [unclassified Rhodococcus (in: high G+C Gram-positive bacteria)]MBY6687927.1 ParB/RepB/Spo0J family partition protein [Rhodococcus sp. BP-288]MBY6696380.1 ParB/RepB/Spo0J family partition protein [Rhodococcus sp. BP-188]MBY6700851.1 ParB/RepB/Spo0J family partition protein [Rhodococcus sp. BP-285]MBY6701618.1 ParB/RepB/Spo0J family partition protein [Rhodococcus sp. BP-283]MBY6707471.1 ParB/RepB/Spo0J family partition protein [Rhodococc
MSSTKKGGLGRGLAALIPTSPGQSSGLGSAAADVVIGGESRTATAPSPTPPSIVEDDLSPAGAVYREIAPSKIEPNPKQPRSVFEQEALDELVHSIREFGLMQPIVVRQIGDDRYQLVMGERRWRASQEAGLDAIPAIVRETADDTLLRDALLENIHRVQLNPLEEAAAYQQLLEEFDVTHDQLAARLGRSRPVITNMIRLLRLPIPVQRRVAAGVLSAGHARALLSLEAGAAAQEELAARIVAEGMSVRATEEAVTLANREDPAAPAPAPKRKPIQMPGLQDVAERLSESFDTRVTVSLGKRKGKIVVEFGSVDDLQRIVEMMERQKSS